jgi:hypothetical protein
MSSKPRQCDPSGASFQVGHQQPNYRGWEPDAAYFILINRTAISPRAEDIAVPSLKNTLSAATKIISRFKQAFRDHEPAIPKDLIARTF